MRTNTYDPSTRRITLDPVRADAFNVLERYYADIFSNGRGEYAIPARALSDTVQLRQMSAFFWWTSWAASPIVRDPMSPTPRIGRTNRWSETSLPAARWFGAS
jgi:nitric oxide reductase subunit B